MLVDGISSPDENERNCWGISRTPIARFCETKGTVQIAALSDLQQNTARRLEMVGAQAAVEGAAALDRSEGIGRMCWNLWLDPIGIGRLAAPQNRLEKTMFGANLAEINIFANQDPLRREAREAFRANTLSGREDLAGISCRNRIQQDRSHSRPTIPSLFAKYPPPSSGSASLETACCHRESPRSECRRIPARNRL